MSNKDSNVLNSNKKIKLNKKEKKNSLLEKHKLDKNQIDNKFSLPISPSKDINQKSKSFSKKGENEFEEIHEIQSNKGLNKKSITVNITCKCKKSKCLKLYCECFTAGIFCKNCDCKDCNNKIEFEEQILLIKKQMTEKNPAAFQPKVDENVNKHYKGCNCKNSGCQKKYCECFQNGISCSESCKCKECKNNKEFPSQTKCLIE